MTTTTVACDWREACPGTVTHIDTAGFVYCANHGARRAMSEPCRTLTHAEREQLARGERISRY